MPSTLVHVAFAGLLAAALLGSAYDRRAVLLVLGAAAVPDLDSFAVVLFAGAHRALLHTFLLPLAAGAVVFADTRLRDRSALGRLGPEGVRVAWVAIAAVTLAGIGLDFVTNGAAVLYPLVDQFYVLNGRVELSTTQGLIQTFVEVPDPSGGSVPAPESVGSTENVTYTTAVDPSPEEGVEPATVERIVPVVRSGWQLLVVVAGAAVTAARFRLD
jgi:hypothetical protein